MSNLVSQDFTKEQLDLIKNTIAKGASNDELKLFLYRAKEMGLDPLRTGQIYFVKYGSSPGTIIVGLEGFRARAAATAKHVGTKRGLIFENEEKKDKIVGAWCEIYRSDWTHPAREEVMLSEYNTGKAMWAKMPATMIKKVAEVAALRIAFPDQLSGLYSQEEMDQASNRQIAPHNYNPDTKTQNVMDLANKPGPQLSGYTLPPTDGEFIIRDGQFAGQTLKDLSPWEVHNSLEYRLSPKGPKSEESEHFIYHATGYLAEIAYIPPEKIKHPKKKPEPLPMNEPIFEDFPKDEA